VQNCDPDFRVYRDRENEEAKGPDKSPKKPSAKQVPDRSLKEKRQDKKGKKAGNTPFGGSS
jgi:hypothetical protein